MKPKHREKPDSPHWSLLAPDDWSDPPADSDDWPDPPVPDSKPDYCYDMPALLADDWPDPPTHPDSATPAPNSVPDPPPAWDFSPAHEPPTDPDFAMAAPDFMLDLPVACLPSPLGLPCRTARPPGRPPDPPPLPRRCTRPLGQFRKSARSLWTLLPDRVCTLGPTCSSNLGPDSLICCMRRMRWEAF